MSLPKGKINNNALPFLLLQAHPDDYHKLSSKTQQHAQTVSPLPKLFFHQRNIDLIQKQIIKKVFDLSSGKYLIEKQNPNDLEIVMKSIYQNNSLNLLDNTKQQLRTLNDLIVSVISSDIISHLDCHFKYLDDVFGPVKLMDRPKNVSCAGSKTLPSFSQLFE